jgi:TatD DNase family protein
MDLVDTHCHIQSAGGVSGERQTLEIWEKDLSLTGEALIEHAQKSGVTRLLCVGCDLDDSKLAIDFVADKPNAWATIGIHPHEAKVYAHNNAKQTEFAALAKADKVVAIGECGLDYFYDHSPQADQFTVLRFQLELAQEHDLPMIFHVREAFDDFWPIFDEYHSPEHPIRGVLHSYTDSMANLDKAQARGLYIGVNGIATFAKSDDMRAMWRAVPLQKLLLETDAPFLTPSPYRGTINEPKHVRTIAEFVAQLRGDNLNTLAATTTANSQQLFGI